MNAEQKDQIIHAAGELRDSVETFINEFTKGSSCMSQERQAIFMLMASKLEAYGEAAVTGGKQQALK